jgi:regulator of protease activity HflC (stomatin/prohibitin superfamily)
VGPEYAKTIVVPEVHAIIRKSFGRFTAEELYTTKRYFAENTLEWGVNKVGQKYIILDDLLIETITLPRAIETAIYGKETAAIKVQEMNFQVQVAESDAKRRQAEAVGIKNANALISESISEQILRHEGITAALELAKSTNAKIVVVGDKNGLPLFYDPAAPTTPAKDP